jgi:hypothetical protein
MRVYIAGRVTGLPHDQVANKFQRAEVLLRASNHIPVNPLKHVNCKADQCTAMKVLIPIMLGCEAILLLNDWEFSEGAKIEVQLARYVGMHIIDEDDLT